MMGLKLGYGGQELLRTKVQGLRLLLPLDPLCAISFHVSEVGARMAKPSLQLVVKGIC